MSRRLRKVSFDPNPRRTALKRAGFAILVALVLMLGVLWYGDDKVPPFSLPSASIESSSALIGETGVPTAGVLADDAAAAARENAMPAETPAVETGEEAAVPAVSSTSVPESVPAQPQALPDGYFVQLGVFDATDNAARLLDNVKALDLPVRIQTRVVVGPFHNQREAEAARNRLKDIAEGIVTPPQNVAKAKRKSVARQSSKSRRRAK